MKLKDHVNSGNGIKECLDMLSELRKKVITTYGSDSKERLLISRAVDKVNKIRTQLNEDLLASYPDIDTTQFVYFGVDRAALVKAENSSREHLLPIPKKEFQKRLKRLKII